MAGDKAIIHCCIDRRIYEMLTRHCEETGQTKTTAIKRAIKAYCASEDDNAGGDVPDGGDKDGES